MSQAHATGGATSQELGIARTTNTIDSTFLQEHQAQQERDLASPSVTPDLLVASIESERLVLTAVLTEGRDEITREVAALLASDDFFDERHRNLWQCRQNLEDAGCAVHAAAVLDMGRRLGLNVGGPTYLIELLRDEVLGSASDAAVREAAQRVKELCVRRQIITGLNAALEAARSGMGKVDDLLTMVNDVAENARTQTSTKNSGPQHVSHFVAAASEHIERRIEGARPENVVASGFRGLDAVISGFTEGDLTILAARPSMGKTSFSLSLAMNAAQAQGRNVLYFSTEQSGLQLAYRMLANAARLNSTDMRRGELASGEFGQFVEACERIGNLNLWIDETSDLSLAQLRMRARAFARAHARPMFVVDYLQRLMPHRQADPRVIIGEISTALKTLARELRAPIIALAQLNRELEKRASKRPIMSDLAESGKIEQDADIILFLYRDEVYHPETKEPGITEIIVGKNRDGAIGTAKLHFNAAQQRFEDMWAGS